ncbi:MAG: glycosyltransferase family 9 protein [Oligoflexia bacterium]|nr:glycosyltransferase family 9 protein [Oligoflexia bacterium]
MILKPVCPLDSALPVLREAWESKPPPPGTGRILFVLFSGLGDVIAATGVISRLREAYPQAHITWLTSSANTAIARACSAVDLVLHSNDQDPANPLILQLLKNAHFDRVYSPSFLHNLREWERSNLHAIPFMLTMCGMAFESLSSLKPRLMELEEEEQAIEQCWQELKIEQRSIAVAPISITVPPWPLEAYQELTHQFIKDGYIVAQLGAKNDPLLSGTVDFRGIPLLQAREVIKRSNLFIGNDSGATWLALTTETPVLALMSPHHKATLSNEQRVVGFSAFANSQRVVELPRSTTTHDALNIARKLIPPDKSAESDIASPDLPPARMDRVRFLQHLQSKGDEEQIRVEILARLTSSSKSGRLSMLEVGTDSVAANGRCAGNALIEPEYRWLHEHFSGPFQVISLDARALAKDLRETLRGAVNWLKRDGYLLVSGIVESPEAYSLFRTLPTQFPGVEVHDVWHGQGLGIACIS